MKVLVTTKRLFVVMNLKMKKDTWSRVCCDKAEFVATKKFNSCISEKFSILCFLISHKNIAKHKTGEMEKNS